VIELDSIIFYSDFQIYCRISYGTDTKSKGTVIEYHFHATELSCKL